MVSRWLSYIVAGFVLAGCVEKQPSRFEIVDNGPLQVPVRVVSQAQINESFDFWNSNGTFFYFADTPEYSGKEITKDNATLVCHSIIANRAIAQLPPTQFSDTVEKVSGEGDTIVGSCFVYVSEQSSEFTELSSCAASGSTPITVRLPFLHGIRRVIGTSEYLVAYRFNSSNNKTSAFILDESLNVCWKFEVPSLPTVPDSLIMKNGNAMSHTFCVRLGDPIARDPTQEELLVFQKRLAELERLKTVKSNVSWRISEGNLFVKEVSAQKEMRVDIDDKILTATVLADRRQIVALSRNRYYIISYN